MRNDNYFKRLDYHIQDVPTAPFSGIFFHTESKTAQYLPIEDFLKTCSAEQIAKIFNTEKSPREKNCGLGKRFTDEVQAKRNSGFYLKIEADNAAEYDKTESGNTQSGKDSGNLAGVVGAAGQDFFVHFTVDAAYSVLFDQSYIDIADNAAARLILYFDTDEKSPALQSYRNGLISIRIGKHAAVEIIKIQNFADTALNFETVRMDVGERARVTVHDIQLGSQKSGVSYSSYMQEDWAEVYIFPLYFVDKTRRMDLEHNLIINGKSTLSEIKARGALKNEAHKVFRGNIFLNKGCSASVARFADNSIMLDKNAVGASIPTIFCDEDDVIGEHAASFAAIDKEKLYYLMTRGFDELSAKKLIIDAAFRPVFNSIPDEAIRNRLNAEFDARLSTQIQAQADKTAAASKIGTAISGTETAASDSAQGKMGAAHV
ncbi:Fe-S cluster assembly protein SufD [Treponema sp. OMZ 906]|uniref:Fe-S cluster assembly protein SufD n=1 Tax=Treponema sp. OMZ 906 TaxID=2563662 RepID=UPI0020A4A1BE|nr:Fe-S cluster assembly protein SufD [Treponema sp. OMZ 906]UTC55125.1 Fe-S cluster assembly protein SufD [Treponema sp. OMZ 906]